MNTAARKYQAASSGEMSMRTTRRSAEPFVLDDPGDRDAPAGSRPWSVWIVGQARLQRSRLDHDAYLMRDLIDRIRKHEAWRTLGSDSLESLCRRELRLDPEQVAAVLAAKRGQALGAVLKARHQAKTISQGTRTDREPHDEMMKCRQGTSSEYLLRRLARDFPEILDAFERGEYPSVRQAAIAAGIVKVPSGLDRLRKAWKSATADERAEFMAEATR